MTLTIPAALQTHLASDATTMCFCWKITKTDDVVIGFTNCDQDVIFDGVTYTADTGFTPSAINNVINGTVNDSELLGFLAADAINENDIINKLYDSARISIYYVNWEDVSQNVEILSGYLGTVTRGELSLSVEVRSLRQMLLQVEGREYMATCDAILGDSKCKVDLSSDAAYRINGSVSTVYSRRLFATTTSDILARNSSWFTFGKITWLTGNNAGFVTEIKNHTRQVSGLESWIDMWDVLPRPIEVNDTFTLQVGCNKLISTCKDKFDNVLNFRGFPRMPKTGISIKVASSADVFANELNNGSWYKN